MKFILIVLIIIVLIILHSWLTKTTIQPQTFEDVKAGWHNLQMRELEYCVNETKVDRKLAERWIIDGNCVDDDVHKHYIHCILNRLTMAEKDGSSEHSQYTRMLGIEDPEVIRRAQLDKCYGIKVEDKYDTSFRISQCIYTSVERAFSELNTGSKSEL